MKKIIASCLICAFLVNQSLLSVLAADISVGGPLPTDTNIQTNGNITDIFTNTTVGNGQIGINSFDKFNVNQGAIVNLNLVNSQNKLVNLIFDNSASQINGVVNSYLNGQIGGNVLFANPNGFVVGERGVFNVGSLTLMTPTEDSMKSLINTSVFSDAKSWNESNLESLIGFSFNDNNYLVNGNSANPIELATGKIDISGKINAGAGIDLISGSEINLHSGSELNANMIFSEVGGTVTATKNPITQNFSTAKYPKNLAMQDGKNIVIVASNAGTSDDILSAIVNLKGSINANGADVDIKTEVHKPSGTHDAISRVTFNSNSNTNASNINATAVTKLAEMGNVSISESFIPGVDQVIDLVTSKVTPITEVIVEKDATLSAINDVNLMAITDMTLSSSTIAPILALNYTQIDSKTQAIVKNGAKISAKNLEVDALTNLNLNTSTKVTAMLNQGFNAVWEKVFGSSNDVGNVGISATINTIVNKAIIESGAKLSGVSDNINVIATTLSYHTDAAQNGAIPLIDRNRSCLGAIVDVIVTNIDNEALMYADADITGDLNVQSYYKGNVISVANASSGGGNGAFGWKVQNLLKRLKLVGSAMDWVLDTTNYTDSAVSGAINVAVSNIKSEAKIGSVDAEIKPNIKAGSINLKADLIDDKSSIAAISSSDGTENAKGGAIAVNVKNLDSNASSYGNFTLSNNTSSLIYFTTVNNIVTDNTNVGTYYRLKNSHDVITKAEYDKLPEREQKLYEALDKDVEIYKYNFFEGDVAYTTDSAYKINFSTASGEFYSDSVGNIITKAEYDKLANKSGYTKLDKVYYAEYKPSALSIKSNTEVLQSLVWYDYVTDFINDYMAFKYNDGKQSAANVQSKWEGLEGNNVSNYLTEAGLSEETGLMDLVTSDLVMKAAANVNNFGLQYLFNTYAQSASDARSDKGSATSAYTGAVAVQVFNTTSNAILENNSNVVSNITNNDLANITIEANSNNELWTMATLLNPLTTLSSHIGATGSQNGSGYGAATSISYSDSNTIAKIGDNVNIVKNSEVPNSYVGDVTVSAFSDGNYVTASHGSASADATGGSGSMVMNIVRGMTESGVGTSASGKKIQANNVIVQAIKDANYINPILAVTNGDKAYGAAISGIVLLDSVNSYIKGNVQANNNVTVKSTYDKLAVNAILNLGLAKDKSEAGENPPNVPNEGENPPENVEEVVTTQSKWAKFKKWCAGISDWCANFFLKPELPEDIQERVANVENINIDAAQPSVDDSSAMAGIISFTGIANDVKATISDGANINARNVSVEAKSDDNVYDIGLVLSAKGKTGVGATILADVFSNNVSAIVENASINATNDIIVDAKEDLAIVQASSGIATAKDTAGAGNISSIVQVNKITSVIKNANINQDAENVSTTQKINLNAENKSKEVKTVGAVSIQNSSEYPSENAKAVGATLDGDVVNNDIKAFIDNSKVKASKELISKASNISDFIVIDVAGAAALQGKALAGTIAAYVAVNTIEAYINNSTINAGSITLDAGSDFYELVVNGVVAGGNKTGIGGSIRGDVIYNTINSYIDTSTITAANDVTVINKEDVEQIAISVSGAGSSKEGAYSGVISVLANVSNQNNYIDNSTVTAESLNLDTDRTMFNVAVTGAIAASLGSEGNSIGVSSFAVGIGHYVNTYIKNSNIMTTKDIILTSDFDEDLYSIVFGGAGGNGISGSGAINVIVNESDVNTYVLAEESSQKKQILTDGKLTVKSESNIDTTIIDGNTSISTNNVSAGGAINVYTNKANLKSGVDGVNVDAKNGIDVLLKSQQKQKSVVVGAAGGNSTSVQGSVNNIVVEQKLNSYVKNTKVRSGGNISVQTEDKSDFDAVIGAVAISLGSNAVGASISTAVFGGQNEALVENSVIDNYDENNSLKDLIIKSTQNDDFNNGIIAGSVAGSVGVGGAVSTIIFNKEVLGYANNIQNINDSKFQNITIDSNAKTDLDIIAGGVAGGGTAGVGATVNTITFDKKVESLIKNNSKIVTVNKDTVYANAIDNISISSVAGSGGGSYSASGIISTTLVDSAVNSGVEQSTIIAKEIDVRSDATNNYSDISGAVTGSGVLGVGATVVTNVISYEIQAFLANAIVSGFDKISVNANSDTTFNTYSVSGAGSGSIAGAGVVETNVINNEVIAYILGDIKGNNTSILTVKAKDTANFNGLAGSLAGGLTAGVGATVSTNNVTSTVLAYIGSGANQQINVGDIIVNATGVQNFKDLLSTGFAAGQGSATATVLVNDIDTLVKAYVCDNSNIKSESLSINAEGITTITEDIIGGAGGLYVAVGSSVGVNSIKNIVEAYTGNNVKLNTKTANVKANTTANLGKEDDKLVVVAAAGAAGAAVGAGLKNVIENEVYSYIGNNNEIISTGNIDLLAQADTNIYESVGGGAAGIAGIGASVGVNKIYNTVNSFIGNGLTINTTGGDLSVRALSNEIVDTLAVVVGGAGVALNGGFVNTTIGKNIDNTPEYVLSEEDAKVYDTALKQLDESLSISRKEKEKANENYKNNSGLNSENTLDLFAKSKNAESSIKTSALLDTTSAFVDSDTNLNTRNLTILAQNANDLNINVNGVSIGGVAVGVASGVSNVYTTTNAFVKNNVSVNTTEQIDIKASSIDNQNILVNSATGGVVAGAGGVASINSSKKTNANILASTILNATNDLNIQAVSVGNVTSKVDGLGASGLTVGVMDAETLIQGQTKIYLGDAVSLNSREGNVLLQTDSQEFAQSKANALAGSLIGGTGAESTALTGKDTTVNIGKNLNIFAKLATKIASNSKNSSNAESDGRAYGVISAGGTKTDARIKNIAGVKIADADTSSSTKKILGKTVEIYSLVENNADAKTNAGAGAIVGVGGSGVYTDINSENSILVGKNYEIETSGGAYSVEANTNNTYKAFNDSSAYGVVGVTVGTIENNISSTVDVESNADIVTNGAISIIANNEVKKAIVSNYDLYGGSGGVVGVGSANLVDNIVMNTISTLGGNKAHATGNYDNGYVTIGAQSILNVNQKVHVSAGGAVPVVDGNVEINSRVNTQVNIKNKDIKSYDDDIYFLSNNDINIYAKSDVHSYGGFAAAGGDSIARNNSAIASVIVSSGVNTVSGRDTYIQAITDKSVLAFIYATTHGLIGTVGGSSATAYNNSEAIINIETDAYLKSFDSMNLIVNDNLKNLKAIREAKGTSRILLGIPIVVYGEGKQYETNNANALITLNGTIESGSGANRSLIINSDGTYTSNSINVEGVIGKEKVGEITDSELSADIEALEKTKEYKIAEIDDYIDIEMSIYENAKDARDKSIAQKELLDEENQKMEIVISNAEQIIINNNLIAENQQNADYVSQLEAENLNLFMAIKELDSEIDSSDSVSLSLFIAEISNEIEKNKQDIVVYENAITSLNYDIANTEVKINEANLRKPEIIAFYDEQIADLNDIAIASDKNVYSWVIDDIVINSGSMNITGDVVGNGTIKTAGEGFSINIVNNSINDVVYKDIIIGKNIAGSINAGSIASTIKQIIGDANQGCNISITNTVDANDPNFDLNAQNGYGDMVFRGNIENPNGNIEIINNTGSVLTDGFITAKNLKIFVPNGSYSQAYSKEYNSVSGTNNVDSIIATGDINISSKIIDINGLIQSGSEIKSVTIPDFKVIKEGDKYYQVSGNSKEEMVKNATDEYYCINLIGNGQGDSDLETIKAYFKISNESDTNNVIGDIYLSKTNIQGGNITLTGNIISTTNNGKIVLVNGYGHIDINNNSNFNLVTSSISANDKINGKLTLNDFKFSDTDKGGEGFDNLTQDEVENQNWLSQNAGIYTASVDENGNAITTSSSITNGNGNWGATNSSIREDGAKINSVIYTPGSDAYHVTQSGTSETVTYQEYVKRSWWTELWYGKLYRTVSKTIHTDPVYEVAQNDITVQFQGFDKPQINVTTNGSIIMNGNIGATNGNVVLNSSNGSITTNSINNLISAENIKLFAIEDVGSELKPIQVVVNNGELNVNSDNVYINYPQTGISNIIINATGNTYLSTLHSFMVDSENKIDISAKSLELVANKGSIIWDMTDNEININVEKLKARANGDISIINQGDLNISNISSKSKVSLESKNGSIIAVNTDSINPYNIDAETVVLKALKGYIGTDSNSVKLARDVYLNASADGNINLYSTGRIYADLIKAHNGAVNLDADYGIIKTEIHNNLVYNIYAKNGVNLNTKHGNIENIVINTDGIINASAGYNNDVASGMSDISIYLLSKQELSQEDIESLTNDAEKQAVLNEYQKDLKDMKLGTIKASRNIYIHSEKSIINGYNNSSLSGSHVILSASNGDIGQSDSAIKIDARRDVTAFAGKNSDVYLTSENNLNINEIRSVNEYDNEKQEIKTENVLSNVVLSAKGNIISPLTESNANIIAKNITLNAGKDVGSVNRFFSIDTVANNPENGLKVNALNAYINGVSKDLNLIGAEIDNILMIGNLKDVNINGVVKAKDVIVMSNNTNVRESIINATLSNISDKFALNNAEINGDLNIIAPNVDITEISLSGNINAEVDDLSISSAKNLNIGNIIGKTKDYASKVSIKAEQSIHNGLTDDGVNIYVKDLEIKAGDSIGAENKPLNIKLVEDNTISLDAGELISVNTSGAPANYTNITTKDLYLYTNEDVIIDILRGRNVKIQTTSNNMSIGDMYIENRADLITRNKKIVASNSSSMTVIDADVQLYITQHPSMVKIDATNNIYTPAKNVIRLNDNIFINKKNVNVGMEKTINVASVAAEKNTNVSGKTINKVDNLLYELPTRKTYYENVKKVIGEGIIKNQIDEHINEYNVLEIINNKKMNSKIKYLPKLSYNNIKYKKVRSL